ncbi:hypothetical protein SAMN06265348_10290 [Pedobacter westerhofensis]|uniref:DUF6377 domain-containing protein n=1 Tax=Pedobacter westerhofensis TaxID=425512 RepID=A0A521B884_9SPHI|nr:DUF6377 domain-containing protein [Pedobacter westerhofensis]SMO43332.1 hypothetical protein SAMN06265348_10290 [Pedobacter westerhofensis]
MYKTILYTLIALTFPLPVFSQNKADSLLTVLRAEIAGKNRYDTGMDKQISLLRKTYQKATTRGLNDQYRSSLALFEAFKDYRFDSAYHYVRELIVLSKKLKDNKKLAENRLRLGTTMITAGMFKETFDCLRETNPGLLDSGAKKSYYILYSWAYSDLAKYNGDQINAPEDLRWKYLYLDSAIALCQPGTFERRILEAQRKPGTGPSPVVYFRALMASKLSVHEEAMVATGLSNYSHGDEKVRLLAIAAINDVRSSTYRALALLNLGIALHAQGKITEAYFFLQQALSQANKFGSTLQIYKVTHMLSTVAAARDRLEDEERQRFLIGLACMIAFAVIASLIGFIVFVQLRKVKAAEKIIRETNRRLEEKNRKLWEEGRIKEEYIGYFFSELSRYIIKLDKLKRNAERRAKSGNMDELVRVLEQIDISSERAEFFATFDRIFLKLFPDFIHVFNAMFREEDQIEPKSAGLLTAQLRIFALMRLGIHKNEMIGAILQYTVNTVYTYRFRAKSKALVPAGDFEQRIMGIQVAADQDPNT